MHGGRQRRTRLILFLAIVASIILMMLVLSSHNKAVSAFFRNSFTHQPEKLTELYFGDQSHLPSTYLGGGLVPISFTIHNLEYADTTYRYQVKVVNETGDVLLIAAVQTLTVKQNAARVVTTKLTMGAAKERVRVIIELIDQQQSIHFWLVPASTQASAPFSNKSLAP